MVRECLSDQVKDNQFVSKYDLEVPVTSRMLDLVSEVGELSKEILKGSNYGSTSLKSTEDWEEEIGDVYFSLLSLANSTEVSLVKALDKVIYKYEVRLEKKSKPESCR